VPDNTLITPGWQGAVFIENGLIKVAFRFNKKRFAAISSIKGARYQRDEKLWHLPLSSFENLKRSRHFKEDVVEYRCDPAQLESEFKLSEDQRRAALQRLVADPFSVPEEIIKIARPDLVFRMDAHHRLFLYWNAITPIPEFITSQAGLIFMKGKGTYWLGADRLTDLIKLCRAKKVIFAVEQEAGEFLKQSSDARAALLENCEQAEKSKYTEAGLLPFVSLQNRGTARFKLNYWTAEHLKVLWPGAISFFERKKLSESFEITDLLKALYQAELAGVRIWLTGEVQKLVKQGLERLRRRLEGEEVLETFLILFLKPKLVWYRNQAGQLGLLASDQSALEQGKLASILSDLEIYASPLSDWTVFYSGSDQEVLSVFQKFSEQFSSSLYIPVTADFNAYRDQRAQQEKQQLRSSEYQSLKDCRVGLENQELEMRLFPHQRVAVAWLLENQQAFLGDDMGLGKTLSVLASFEELKAQSKVDFLLLISPASLVRNWLREQLNWVPKLKLVACPSSKKDREILLGRLERDQIGTFDGLVINYESARLASSLESLKQITQHRRVMLCLDESQRIKNPRSVSFRALSELAYRCERRVLLSGTPTPKDLSDIWSQYYLLDGGERFGKNYFEWLTKVAVLGNKWSEFAVKSFKPEAVKQVQQRARELLLRRRKDEVVDLPEKIFSIRDVELTGDQHRRYEELRKDLLLKVTKLSGAEFYKQISSILEQYLRAVQIASNPRLVDPLWQGEPAKFLELDEIVHEVLEQGQKIVIWTNFLGNVAELAKRYAQFGCSIFSGDVPPDERDLIVKDFQSGAPLSAKVVVAVPAAGGVGITLTAAQTAVYLDKTWNAEHWMQSVDRIHRIGQTGVVNIISLHACSVDEVISYSLMRKQKAQARLMGDYEAFELVNAGEGVEGTPTRDALLAALKAAK
jgi:SWI/SNF-related matrix-associated actin-dependent regulator of chromatin subfamily A-like protein 1